MILLFLILSLIFTSCQYSEKNKVTDIKNTSSAIVNSKKKNIIKYSSLWNKKKYKSLKNYRNIIVYTTRNCGCCLAWVDYLKYHDYDVKYVFPDNLSLIKDKYFIPKSLSSCHTAIINNYVVEGHVPVGDIKKLFSDSLEILGLAVPQMPIGSPGMEQAGLRNPFSVFAFTKKSQYIFSRYVSY